MANKVKQIEELMALLEQHKDLNELEITDGDFSVRLSKAPAMAAMQAMPQMPMMPQAAAPAAQAAPAAAPEAAAPAVEAGHQLKSPMVGTFYRKPSPDAVNYVEVGSSVKVGDTLCIIEAMKIMNQIESDTAGTVKAILLDDGSPVEFDQPLFIIE